MNNAFHRYLNKLQTEAAKNHGSPKIMPTYKEHTPEQRKAYQAGQKAHGDGKDDTSNPHPKTHPNHHPWNQGWFDRHYQNQPD